MQTVSYRMKATPSVSAHLPHATILQIGRSAFSPAQGGLADLLDVIHVKMMHSSIPDYRNLIERLARILRPGGMLVLVESEMTYVSCPTSRPLTKKQRNQLSGNSARQQVNCQQLCSLGTTASKLPSKRMVVSPRFV